MEKENYPLDLLFAQEIKNLMKTMEDLYGVMKQVLELKSCLSDLNSSSIGDEEYVSHCVDILASLPTACAECTLKKLPSGNQYECFASSATFARA